MSKTVRSQIILVPTHYYLVPSREARQFVRSLLSFFLWLLVAHFHFYKRSNTRNRCNFGTLATNIPPPREANQVDLKLGYFRFRFRDITEDHDNDMSLAREHPDHPQALYPQISSKSRSFLSSLLDDSFSTISLYSSASSDSFIICFLYDIGSKI